MTESIKILDCTLRDGGHINCSAFGNSVIKSIISGLTKARIDYIELGFLKNGVFDEDQTSSTDVTKMDNFISDENSHSVYTAMIRPDWYDISQLSQEKGRIDIIRLAFYYRDFRLMSEYADKLRARGYGIICNPVNIMGYSPDGLKELVANINLVHPEQLTIVDTYGALTIDHLHRVYDIIENLLEPDIRIGIHLHENQMLANALLQEFLKIRNPSRNVVIDASLLGMGRMPGNLCMEILAGYMNDNYHTEYDESEIYHLISEYIEPLKSKYNWGYNPAYYLTGRMNMHRSYAEYLLRKGVKLYDISYLLKKVPVTYRDEFHQDVIEEIYKTYGKVN